MNKDRLVNRTIIVSEGRWIFDNPDTVYSPLRNERYYLSSISSVFCLDARTMPCEVQILGLQPIEFRPINYLQEDGTFLIKLETYIEIQPMVNWKVRYGLNKKVIVTGKIEKEYLLT